MYRNFQKSLDTDTLQVPDTRYRHFPGRHRILILCKYRIPDTDTLQEETWYQLDTLH
jgi:hypothetical protein